METFLFYLLRSSLVAILLYGIFKAIFSQTTFHRANRIALDSILAVSVVFPLFRFRLISRDCAFYDGYFCNKWLKPFRIACFVGRSIFVAEYSVD